MALVRRKRPVRDAVNQAFNTAGDVLELASSTIRVAKNNVRAYEIENKQDLILDMAQAMKEQQQVQKEMKISDKEMDEAKALLGFD